MYPQPWRASAFPSLTCKVPGQRVVAALAVAAATVAIVSAGDAGERVPPPLLLADFERPDAVTLRADQAEFQRVAAGGGQALQIVTKADAPYPSVVIEPRSGRWDLRGYEAVAVDVQNPQDVSVRVLLSINNPGADGRNHCNTEAVSVVAGGRATLTVPFGMWHGDPGHTLDLANVVSATVLLDKPGRAHRFLVDNVRAISLQPTSFEELARDPFFQQLKPVFGRGVNLGNALEAPREGEWGVTLKAEYFAAIKAAGFQSVRIPVRWSAHAAKTAPYRLDESFLRRVDWAVQQALDRRLEPVLNMHHYDEIFQQPDQHRERFLALWEQIAAHFKDAPPALVFELLNEPNAKLTADKWNRMLAEAIAVVRRTNPTRKIVVGPVGWNAISELPSLRLPDDTNLIVTVHYYSPFKFTHQGASWVGGDADKWLGTKWSGAPAEQQAVRRDLDTALRWAVEHRRPLFLGEFGAFSRADMESRARWTRFVAEEAVRRKIGFAYWEFCSGFGCYDAAKNQWVEPLKDALLGGKK